MGKAERLAWTAKGGRRQKGSQTLGFLVSWFLEWMDSEVAMVAAVAAVVSPSRVPFTSGGATSSSSLSVFVSQSGKNDFHLFQILRVAN